MYQLITNRLPFGQLALERDLVSYLRRGKMVTGTRTI